MKKFFYWAALVVSAQSMAQDIFPAGSENKARGFESLVASERGSAVLYNPSNLTTTPGRRAYVEGGLITLNYAYEHPVYDPVVVKTSSPLVSLGYGGALANNFYFGLILMPVRAGKMDVPGVPRDVSGIVIPVEVRNEELAIRSGMGIGYKLHESVRLGLSLIHSFEHRKLSANIVGNPNEVINFDVYHQSVLPKLGLRGSSQFVQAGLSWSPAQEKSFEGGYTSASNPEVVDPPIRDYTPMQFGLGVVGKYLGASLEINAVRDFWRAGRDQVSSGQGQYKSADLSDTTNWGVSLGYDTGRQLKFIAGYADRPSPWGDGRNIAGEELVSGADFGVMNAIARKNLSAGTQFVLSPASRLETAIYHSAGQRENPEGSATVGRFQVAITAFTATLSQRSYV